MNNNNRFLNKLSIYLNNYETSINKTQIQEVTSCGVDIYNAYFLLLSEYLELDDILRYQYLPYSLHMEKEEDYITNAYYQNIPFEQKRIGKWVIKYSNYAPFELFVRDDFIYMDDKVIPQIGFFVNTFSFPSIYENGRLWMSITPNEINTMKYDIENAFGSVLTFGLGLGYFAYMVSLKDNVTNVTIVEKDLEVIELFTNSILPKFKAKNKIKIIHDDAYHYLENMDDDTYNYVFVDIYHDASDGLIVYNKCKALTNRFLKTRFSYWIKKTIAYYTKE